MSVALHAQDPSSPHFEVASVKPGGETFSTRPERSGGRIRWTTQLCYLAGYATHLDSTQVSGPKCGSVYSLEATFDPSASDDQVRMMVQSLLTERFQMRAHRVATESNGYALTVARGGLKMRETKSDAAVPSLPEWVHERSPSLKTQNYISATMPEKDVTAIIGRGVTMAQLAETLQRVMQVPVWDRTGSTGKYYFAFRYSDGLGTEMKNDAPSLAAALQENLGIKLDKQKGPSDRLVIDSILEPTPN